MYLALVVTIFDGIHPNSSLKENWKIMFLPKRIDLGKFRTHFQGAQY